MAVKDLKECGVVDDGSLEVPPKSEKKTKSDNSSEGNGAAVKELKNHDGVDEGSLEVPLKS